MGKFKELTIDVETSSLDGKPLISIIELPQVMADHMIQRRIQHSAALYTREEDLLNKILTRMALAVIRDQFNMSVEAVDHKWKTPIIKEDE